MAILAAALLVVLVLMGASFYLVQQNTAKDQSYLQLTAELRALSFRVTSLAREATSGNEQAFPELAKVITEMGGLWDRLRASDIDTRTALAEEFAGFDSIWQSVKASSNAIVTNKDTIIFLNDVAITLNESLMQAMVSSHHH